MKTSNVSELGKIFIQGQKADAGIAVPDDMKTSFSDMMSQMAAMTEGELFAGMAGAGGMSADAPEQAVAPAGSERDYARYGQRREVQTADATGAKWKDDDRMREAMEQFSGEVREVLKEELGVSEEQIEDAMATLGLTYADLLNPNQLASLVAELMGTSERGALLVSGEFMAVMKAVDTLGENLLQELGMTREEFMAQLKMAMDAPDGTPDVTAIPEEGLMTEDTAAKQPEAVTEQQTAEGQPEAVTEQQAAAGQPEAVTEQQTAAKQPEATAEQQETVETAVQTETAGTKQAEPKDVPAEEPEDAEVQKDGIRAGENLTTEKAQSDAQDTGKEQPKFGQNRETAGNAQAAEHVGAGNGAAQNTAAQTATTGNTAGFAGQMDVQNIVRQIAEFSRVVVSNTATTMEMQLNPENLGKILLSVTTKNGVVSAQIFTQNEAVRDALEQQLVTLKQEMNQAGVKVDAVEVTVGSHEFERNLEQNAQQEERQAEQQEKTAGRTRHINLNDLDELAGVMSEEESLVAQMMAEQGNSVDFTA